MPGTGPHQIELDAWISCAPFEKHLNMQIVRADRGESVLTMPFARELAQGIGLMHGGALVSLADAAVVIAIKSVVAPDTEFVTTRLESRFLYPVKKGVVTARARVVQKEDRLFDGRVVLYDEEKREVLHHSSQFKITHDAQNKSVPYLKNAADR